MKILLIDNGSKHLTELKKLCDNYHIEVIEVDAIKDYINDDYDAIILSGSALHPATIGDHSYYADEIKLIEQTDKPILGICLGFEEYIRGEVSVQPINDGITIFLGAEPFSVYEAHHWVVPTVVAPLYALAESKNGVEAFRHMELPIFGFQFHPEVELTANESREIWKQIIPDLLKGSQTFPHEHK
jgi:anthranilate/para-aminobenzoate synthase component II